MTEKTTHKSSMSGYTFTLVLMLLGILAGLVYSATLGSVIAAIVLAMLVTIVLVSVGAGIALATQRMANDKAQTDFVNNAKENLAIMQTLQRIQNAQNQTLMHQLTRTARLPEPQGGLDLDSALLIDDGLFSELED